MKRTIAVLAAMLLATGAMAGTALAQGQTTNGNAANSLGKTTLDTEVVDDGNGEMLYGDGIPNGEWITAEVQGVEVGLRATDRTDGLLDVSGTNGNRVGVYGASTGFDDGTKTTAEWNYEWSVDLRNATGNAEGTTLSDYSLVLWQDYTEQSLFESDEFDGLGTDPVQLPMPSTCHHSTDYVCQQSWNPTFGNDDFGPEEDGTYNLRLVLAPETFDGPPIAVAIEVNVTNPAE